MNRAQWLDKQTPVPVAQLLARERRAVEKLERVYASVLDFSLVSNVSFLPFFS